jgi:hypothetical protein
VRKDTTVHLDDAHISVEGASMLAKKLIENYPDLL